MMLVIDASVAIAWASPDENDSFADEAMRLAVEHGAAVPTLWPLEVANILVVNERRGRLTAGEAKEIMDDLKELALTVDPETTSRAMEEIAALAREHRLSVYDASYLELAQRLSLPLATLDRDLRKAAKAIGLPDFFATGGQGFI